MFTPPPFHPARPHLVAPVRVDPQGVTGPTRAQARGRAWRAVAHGWYVPAHADTDDPWQRSVQASVLSPDRGGVTGWAALNWLGGHWFDGRAADGHTRLPVPLATAGFHVRSQPGVRISEEKCDPDDIIHVDGLRITTPVRSVCFEMRYAASDDLAVTALDMAAFSDLVSIQELTAYAVDHPAWTGIPQCRRAIPHADENSWSPRETLMRRIWERDAECPRPLCNVPVFDRAGRHIGTPDLIDPERGVVGEYEGTVHLVGKQRAKDVRREAEFRGVGLEYVTMLGADFADPGGFTTRLRQAYGRAGGPTAERRRWTLETPPWWIPTVTVGQRRALDERMRERLLRHRRAAA